MSEEKECTIEECKACEQKAPSLNKSANLFLVLIKGAAGYFTGSRALMADSLHSVSELVCSLITIQNVSLEKEPGGKAPYNRAESLTSVFVGVILVFTALYISFGSLRVLLMKGYMQPPGMFAFWVAVLSVYLNFFVSSYADCPAKELNNASLKTIVKDNRFDAYLSIPVALCILFSQFGYPRLDAAGALAVGLIILKTGLTQLLENRGALRDISRNLHPQNMTPDQKKIYAAKFSVYSNSVLVVGKFAAGFVTGSISIISEAIHSSLDLVAALIANYSVRKASVPADDEHRFGHGKYENVSALLEGMLIFFAAYLIFYEASKKLLHGVHLEVIDLGIAIMLVATVANFLISQYLFKVAKETDSEALEADALHLRTDVMTSAGVFLGLLLIRLVNRPGIEILDPIIAILTALIITHAAYELCREAIRKLLDSQLPEEEEEVIINAIKQNTENFAVFHSLRTRKSGSSRHIDMHLVVPNNSNIEEAHKLSRKIEHSIKESLDNADIIIHIEPCAENCQDCSVKCDKTKRTQDIK